MRYIKLTLFLSALFFLVRCRVSWCKRWVFWKSFRNSRQGRVTHQRGPACEQQLNRETRSGPHCSPPCCFAEFQAWGRLYQVRIVAFENQPPRFSGESVALLFFFFSFLNYSPSGYVCRYYTMFIL